MQQKIVLIGGPGTGKSSVLQQLEKMGYACMPEISREITLQAQKDGIEQLFLTDPILFSEKLLEGRTAQYISADTLEDKLVFFDRGIPSITAYMDYANTSYPDKFIKHNKQHKYTKVFQFKPWEQIYQSDNERYETFEQAQKISTFLTKTYKNLGYKIIDVPFFNIEERCEFILTKCN